MSEVPLHGRIRPYRCTSLKKPPGVPRLRNRECECECERECPLGPLGYEGAQHRQTLRPTVDGTRSKALRPLGPLGFNFAQHGPTTRPSVERAFG